MKRLLMILMLFVAFTVQAQKNTLLSASDKYVVMDVKSKQPYFEFGEVLTFRIDGNFYLDRNNYAKLGGSYFLGKKSLMLVFDSFVEERKRMPKEYKISEWKKDGFILKYRNKYNKKEKVYFKPKY